LLIHSHNFFQTFEESVEWFMQTQMLSRDDGMVLLDMKLD
jgi:hypothetical protein